MSENQNIEYKLSWRDECLKWICGFANAQVGTLIIGKDDEGNIDGALRATNGLLFRRSLILNNIFGNQHNFAFFLNMQSNLIIFHTFVPCIIKSIIPTCGCLD
jgi:hypothetical protein